MDYFDAYKKYKNRYNILQKGGGGIGDWIENNELLESLCDHSSHGGRKLSSFGSSMLKHKNKDGIDIFICKYCESKYHNTQENEIVSEITIKLPTHKIPTQNDLNNAINKKYITKAQFDSLIIMYHAHMVEYEGKNYNINTSVASNIKQISDYLKQNEGLDATNYIFFDRHSGEELVQSDHFDHPKTITCVHMDRNDISVP